MSNSTNKTSAHKQLTEHAMAMRNLHLRDMFLHDPDRANNFALDLDDIIIDYSKNLITDETLKLLSNYSDAIDLKIKINAMFSGEKINTTEQRAVLHTALRSASDDELIIDGNNIIEKIHAELDRIKTFTTAIHNGKHQGWTGKAIDTFVNIGIGGSDLGPKMVIDALTPWHKKNTRTFFISNLDDKQIESLKSSADPETCLFIIASKSFSTLETKTNAETLRTWLIDSGCDAIDKHFIAVSSNNKAAIEFGINPNNIFEMWDWVGGRFSLWSAIGLPIALALGYENFQSLLTGAREMDQHFKNADITENAPVILGLLDFWNHNFLDMPTHAFIPYDEGLRYFPDYLAQLLMESNGKSAGKNGHLVEDKTSPIVWGSAGTNAQHAFFQLLHQGTQTVPVDFLVSLTTRGNKKNHELLFANCLAQSQALMLGENNQDAHRHFPGNKPSTTLAYTELNPYTLGKLIALYEHRTFVQGLLWNINSFDQWGVELGKKLATSIYQDLQQQQNSDNDSSTNALIDHYKKTNQN